MIERAFPLDHTPSTGYQRGMSLRDKFADSAISGVCLNRTAATWLPKNIAKAAYDLADAMMAAREA